eukprot:TRINITY_DN5576_c0_g2_i1.p3 TRINITY_DN5576_c0_g2~~TRINITY_DN5576_c0_g2_i1.p3  ORF type:complete len:113 (-),score=4.69 TRINITY_DN5576_c0_g2_i1:853-1191(-)
MCILSAIVFIVIQWRKDIQKQNKHRHNYSVRSRGGNIYRGGIIDRTGRDDRGEDRGEDRGRGRVGDIGGGNDDNVSQSGSIMFDNFLYIQNTPSHFGEDTATSYQLSNNQEN